MNSLKVTASVNDKALVDSGVVHLAMISDVVNIDISGYQLTICFVDEGSATPPRWQGAIEGSAYRVTLYNHNNINEYVYQPIVVGQVSGKRIFLTYNSSLLQSVPNGVRRFEYCIWLEN